MKFFTDHSILIEFDAIINCQFPTEGILHILPVQRPPSEMGFLFIINLYLYMRNSWPVVSKVSCQPNKRHMNPIYCGLTLHSVPFPIN